MSDIEVVQRLTALEVEVRHDQELHVAMTLRVAQLHGRIGTLEHGMTRFSDSCDRMTRLIEPLLPDLIKLANSTQTTPHLGGPITSQLAQQWHDTKMAGKIKTLGILLALLSAPELLRQIGAALVRVLVRLG